MEDDKSNFSSDKAFSRHLMLCLWDACTNHLSMGKGSFCQGFEQGMEQAFNIAADAIEHADEKDISEIKDRISLLIDLSDMTDCLKYKSIAHE